VITPCSMSIDKINNQNLLITKTPAAACLPLVGG
jgi:hypothetical protein